MCIYMDSRKRSGRYKRLEAIRGERRKQKQKQQLATILLVGGGVLVLVVIIVVIALGGNRTPTITTTPIAITPYARLQANGLAMGNPDALVRVDVWEDFQCPMCVQYTQNVERKLVDTYIAEGKVYYVFHQYPFIDRKVGGKESAQSANASMCANEQGRFWDYHDMLYANWKGEGEGAFTDKRLITFAEMLGLDMGAFNSCFNANRYKDQIEKDYQAGITIGVSGTPSVYVNNKYVTPRYVPTYEQMVQAIEEASASK
jgi:protein-disulfide isomerase